MEKQFKSSIFITLFLLLIFPTVSFSQSKNIGPIWTFHDDSTNIYGLSLGLGTFSSTPRNTNTNGVKVEVIGAGLLLFLGPRSPVAVDSLEFSSFSDSIYSERINGISISPLGTVCNCKTNGITIGGIGHYNQHVNGMSSSFFYNFTQVHKGVQLSLLFNQSYVMHGLQLGTFNYTEETKGVQIGLFNHSISGPIFQIGLWNVNEKRKFPIINWNFSKK